MTARVSTCLALLALAATDAGARCGPSKFLRPGITAQVISIDHARDDAPLLYLRPGAGPVVFYFRPDDVVAELQSVVRLFHTDHLDAARDETQKFLDAVSADLPLRENTDFLKYSRQDEALLPRMEYLVADLMKLGKVMVSEGFEEMSIVMVSQLYRGSEMARWFCTHDGVELFSVQYIVLD